MSQCKVSSDSAAKNLIQYFHLKHKTFNLKKRKLSIKIAWISCIQCTKEK